MVSVASLLNPVPSAFQDYRQISSPCSTTFSSELGSPTFPPTKKQKMSKDAAVFAKGKIKGEVRYPPCEFQTEELAVQHRKFQVFPMGHIAEYRRHIPYNSEKKSFLRKTGRESFEVFQYTFKVPGDEKEYTVMWDYNVGLVRITPFFKCCNYAKTIPAKMLNSNPGLRDVCHSITGGALAAQGYWMPFEAAKAVAATFCYRIRYALTPVFGLDFPSLCIDPGDENFSRMIIDRSIVRKCTDAANGYRTTSTEGSTAGSPSTPASAISLPNSMSRSLRPKQVKTIDSESGYGTDTDRSDRYLCSPQTSFRWTSLNTVRSASSRNNQLPSPRETSSGASLLDGSEAPPNSPETSSSESGGKAKRVVPETDEDYDDAELSTQEAPPRLKSRKKSLALPKEARAAYLLMQLHMADASLKDDVHGVKRRRASS